MSAPLLQIEGLSVRVEDKEILHGIDLQIKKGETHVLMGPNGAGKSTLGYALMGNPKYQITGGKILFEGKDISEEAPDKRASSHGGHFGPNFGMVEATIALHYVFESPKDKIVYDVSHQTYPHKMLTGRKEAYLYEEHYDDVSGYSNPNESVHDHFTVGHTSTSVSLACGLAKARDLKGEEGNVIAVIGDGSLSGGEALEGLDYAVELDGNLIIIEND